MKTETTCVQCDATRRLLNKLGIPFIERSLEEHPETVEAFKADGYMQAPIVQTNHGVWSGFRPELIKALAKENDAQP